MQANTTNKLHIEVNHFPSNRLIAHGDGLSTETASGVLYRGVCLGKDLVEIFGTSGCEILLFDLTESYFGLFD